MNIDEVISNAPTISYWFWNMPIEKPLTFLVILVATILAVLFAFLVDGEKIGIGSVIGMVITSAMVSGIFLGFFSIYYAGNIKENTNQLYFKEYVQPFIESLPMKKSEVIGYESGGESWREAGGLYYEQLNIQREDFDFRIGLLENGKVIERNVDAEIVYEKNIDKPYFTYKFVEKDLPYSMYGGYYYGTLHLPETFSYKEWNSSKIFID